MFGCVLAGQPVQTNFERLTECDFVLKLAHLEPSFLTIFLTSDPLPDGYAAAIYISMPSEAGQGEHWNYLGYISNHKPSGTFKVSNLKRMAIQNLQQNRFGNFTGPQIGITVKQAHEVEQFTPAVAAESSPHVAKIAENLYNYCASFASGDSNQMVPITTIERWYKLTRSRLEQNPSFFR